MTPRDWTPADAADAADDARHRQWWKAGEPEFADEPEEDAP